MHIRSLATLPALSEKAWLRLTLFTVFYWVQGLPLGFSSIALPAWLLAQGLTPMQVSGLTGVAGLPWAFKLFAGPLMDRFSVPAMGIRRPWVLGMQLMIALSAASLLFIHDVDTELAILTALCFALNSFAAAQDVAVDGMAVSLLRESERGRANALMAAGQVIGISTMGSTATKALNSGGLPAAGLLLGAMILAVSICTLLFRERPGEKLMPWTGGQAHPEAPQLEANIVKIVGKIGRSLLLPMSLLLIGIEILNRTIAGMTIVWFPDLAINRLGYLDTSWADWFSILGAIAAVLGVFCGPLIDRLGLKRSLVAALILNAFVYFLLFLSFDKLANPSFGIFALGLMQLALQLMFVCLIAIFMTLCHAKVAASQFAVYMALGNVGRQSGIFVYPICKDWFDLKGLFIVGALGYLLCAALLLTFREASHRLRLERLFERDSSK
ncbi:MFS transporter [Pelagicoccus sp. SDUM812002]|uniref:MFS transporter n=1 Tax=Pelagicoccus sp. SDUM812002 TaxID=3041266 RepID=UPI0028108E60|nr:MFS transporter [Pelagicoccus sp. SDUM812002]MDQ8188342.1 MFS transporter [Pelagicoccus sp. SDUM812002]